MSIINNINNSLKENGLDAEVSGFYSEPLEGRICIKTKSVSNELSNKNSVVKEIIDVMKILGYKYYDAGTNMEWLMITFVEA